MIREILNQIISEEIPTKKVALMLSGGVDSLTLGFSVEDLDREVIAYTFQLEGNESEDVKAARYSCRKLGWDFNLVEIPTENLKEDCIRLARQYNCRLKTQFECIYPIMHFIPHIKEKYVLSGLAADGHYGLSRTAMIQYRHTLEKLQEFRKKYFGQENIIGYLQYQQIFKENNKILSVPYLDQRVIDYFMDKSWEDINKPIEKYLIIKDYEEKFTKTGIRRHANYQLVAGVDKLFYNTLIPDKTFNKKGRKRVLDLCRDLHKEYAI